MLPLLRVHSQYFRLCTFPLPELRVFRGSTLQVQPVLAVVWEDTASIGNILGQCNADWYYTANMRAVRRLAVRTLILRVLAALQVHTLKTPSILWIWCVLRSSEIFSAGNTGDAASTDWRYFRVWYCPYWEYWHAISRYCLCYEYTCRISDSVRLYCLHSRAFRSLILQVLPVLAEIWEVTASIGKFLGYALRIISAIV